SAVWLPKAASIRCQSSSRKCTTYTAWAAIRPRYSGSCSQRLAKIRLGSGRRAEGTMEPGALAMKGGWGWRGNARFREARIVDTPNGKAEFAPGPASQRAVSATLDIGCAIFPLFTTSGDKTHERHRVGPGRKPRL